MTYSPEIAICEHGEVFWVDQFEFIFGQCRHKCFPHGFWDRNALELEKPFRRTFFL